MTGSIRKRSVHQRNLSVGGGYPRPITLTQNRSRIGGVENLDGNWNFEIGGFNLKLSESLSCQGGR